MTYLIISSAKKQNNSPNGELWKTIQGFISNDLNFSLNHLIDQAVVFRFLSIQVKIAIGVFADFV